MGTFSKGGFGGFRGKVGSMVGSSWKGLEVLRSKPVRRRAKSSPDQLQQQAKFALMTKFLRPLTPLLDQAYNATVIHMSGFNKALSYNILNAIAGIYPAYTVNYPKILLGQGDLANAELPAGGSAAAGKLSIRWEDNSGSGSARAGDRAFVAVYCAELNRWSYKQDAAIRSDGIAVLDVPAFAGKKVQNWLGFVSARGNRVTTSLYVGEVDVL